MEGIIGIILIIISIILSGTPKEKGCAWLFVIVIGVLFFLISIGVSAEDVLVALLFIFITLVVAAVFWALANSASNKKEKEDGLQKNPDMNNSKALKSQITKGEIDIKINELVNKKLSLHKQLFKLQNQLIYKLNQIERNKTVEQKQQQAELSDNDENKVYQSELAAPAKKQNKSRKPVIAQNDFQNTMKNPIAAPKDKRDIFYKNITVAGTQFVPPEALENLLPDEKITLVREPHNKYDANAIALHRSGNRKIGYVFRTDNPILAKALDKGEVYYGLVTTAKIRSPFSRIDIDIFKLHS